jgi:Cu2+-exporting ATPase
MMIQDFRRRFWISTLLTVPVLLLSPMIQEFLGISLRFPGDAYLLFLFSSVIYFFGGWPFLQGLYSELKNKAPGMMTLIALAVSVAYFYSVAVVFGLPGMSFFWELATLIDIMLLGHWLEMKSVSGAGRALESLVQLMPATAHRVRGDQVEDVPLEQLEKGDTILIKPGEKIPADGLILEGESHLNESMLTGESKPVRKSKGEKVIGGSINGSGSLTVRVEHTGKDSYLAKVIDLVQQAQKTKSKTQRLADRAAQGLTYVALAAGFITLAAWLITGREFAFALERMVTVMVISCPHALGLAIPLVVAISTALSAQSGLLIRNRTAFENSRRISTIVFDKTGTLTQGEFGVSRYGSLDENYSAEEILQLAGSLEQHSEHPIAAGVLKKIKERRLTLHKTENFKNLTGLGIQGRVEGRDIRVVGPGALKETGAAVPREALSSAAETVVFVLVEKRLAGYLALADQIRPESAEAVARLRKIHIKAMMATGDNEAVAKAVSEELGLDGYFAGVLPHEKLEIVKGLQQKGEFVAMTGDGVNDAPALAQADVGIAVGSGTDVAAETADIILVNSNPRDIAALVIFGRATYNKMIQNLLWAAGYNAVAIPLAAGVLYPWGIVLGPAVGAVLMSLSTIIVAINAQLLKRKQYIPS